MDRKELGRWGEGQAREYLQDQGFVILEENYRCKLGEIDLIALDGECLVFIEVKTRTSTAYGFPAEAVGRKKQNKYIQIASLYTRAKGLYEISFRFDVVEVMVKNQGEPNINHIVNAFQSSGRNYYI
jgi:putative endonuclease